MKQLAFDIRISSTATFDHYVVGDNARVVRALSVCAPEHREPCLFLWGASGSGLTHLMHASCHHRIQQGMSAAYLPLSQYPTLSDEILSGMETMDLLCVDDVDLIAGKPHWEQALFHAYNRCQQTGTQMLFSSKTVCNQLHFHLSDLHSRLLSAVALPIHPLSDQHTLAGLQQHAKARGLYLSDKAGYFLLNHYTRDMKTLSALLHYLDKASLVAQRKLSIPFIKRVLSQQKSPCHQGPT